MSIHGPYFMHNWLCWVFHFGFLFLIQKNGRCGFLCWALPCCGHALEKCFRSIDNLSFKQLNTVGHFAFFFGAIFSWTVERMLFRSNSQKRRSRKQNEVWILRAVNKDILMLSFKFTTTLLIHVSNLSKQQNWIRELYCKRKIDTSCFLSKVSVIHKYDTTCRGNLKGSSRRIISFMFDSSVIPTMLASLIRQILTWSL